MVKDPVARTMVGFLLVRGGVHIVAYAKALEKLSGVPVGGLLPIPDISNKRFPESRKHEEKGLHRILYRFSPNDYRQITEIWNGPHPEDGSPLEVRDGQGVVIGELVLSELAVMKRGDDVLQLSRVAGAWIAR